MDSIEKVIKEFFPNKSFSRHQLSLIKWVMGEKKLPLLTRDGEGKRGIEWIHAMAESLQLRCEVHCNDYENIPASGATIIVSNHPTVMDGLALINTVSRVRKDIKILANHVLPLIFPSVNDITIGVKNMHGRVSRQQLKEMNDHLKNGGLLIICPAGRLAHLSFTGLRESEWNAGFVQLARKHDAALVPVFIRGHNSLFYYLTALIWRPLSNLMIVRECIRHRGDRLMLRICKQINLSATEAQDTNELAKEVYRHLLSEGHHKRPLLPTCPPLAAPEERSLLQAELNKSEVIKTLSDGKILYLYHYSGKPYSPVIQELGRLREICFRHIGAGTGTKRDNDDYDRDYYHIILWEPRDLEIAGAYRLMPGGEQITKRGVEELYSHSLFRYQDTFIPKVEKSIEIGRGFIQKKYQKSNALDALWRGIFIFSSKYPDYKYFMGVLTIPKSYSEYAQQLIVSFFQTYFSGSDDFLSPVVQYKVRDRKILTLYSGNNFQEDWRKLNNELHATGCELPWPYKQAAKWYNPGGSKILCFIEDKNFNSIAALNLCEIARLKTMYQSHYVARK